MKAHQSRPSREARPPQLTLRGLLVLVTEAALVCAALSGLSQAEAKMGLVVTVVPLAGALWGGFRGRRTIIGAFRGGVFGGAAQSALFAVWEVGRLLMGGIRHPDLSGAAVAAYEVAVVLVASLLLGAILGLMVGAGLRLGSPPARRTVPSRLGEGSRDEPAG